jgi:hypothetical protein
MTIEAHPLSWPVWRTRTPRGRREPARFETTFAAARDGLLKEIELMGGRRVVLSSNIPLRRDGLPYANAPRPDDVGVAVYFDWKGKPMCFACDRWDRVEHNLQGIRKTIDALRGIARWGTGEMMQTAFTGFAALPAPEPEERWWDVLGIDPKATASTIETAYRRRRSEAHPDKGGDPGEFDRVEKAYRQATA